MLFSPYYAKNYASTIDTGLSYNRIFLWSVPHAHVYCQEKNCPSEKIYPRTKFSAIVLKIFENFCPPGKILPA